MKISLQDGSTICKKEPGETILFACARVGTILSAPCGGQRHCGKCRVRILEGHVSGDTPDANGYVRACKAVPVSDIIMAYGESSELSGLEITTGVVSSTSVTGAMGVAIDIGTTTVSAQLVDLSSSSILDTVSELNDQRTFGADVMSRIEAAARGKKNFELHKAINRQTERILIYFKTKFGIQQIERLAVSGNTVMLHFFLGEDPSGMGVFPFTPKFLEEKEVNGRELSLSVDKITVLPSIAAFIGGDITAGLAVTDILSLPGPSLLVDIGTNGEMALAHKETIYCCSTAAGPVFEGAEISCGIGGVKGAISGVVLADGQAQCHSPGLSLTVIGNSEPTGICGSGLIDSIAIMLKAGIIDETGFMTCPAFILSPRNSSPASSNIYFDGVFPEVSIIPRDIRQFQLGKSAIYSGIKTLCKNAGLSTIDVRNIFIAGGFGFFINKNNAVATGIFPEEFLHKISISGNLSLKGAVECLCSDSFMDRCRKIKSRCSVIDLATDPVFIDEFAENMLFQSQVIF